MTGGSEEGRRQTGRGGAETDRSELGRRQTVREGIAYLTGERKKEKRHQKAKKAAQ